MLRTALCLLLTLAAGSPSGAVADGPGPAPSVIIASLVKREKRSPTSPDNVGERFQELLDLTRHGRRHFYLPPPLAFDISRLLDEDDAEGAARILRFHILRLSEKRPPAGVPAPHPRPDKEPGSSARGAVSISSAPAAATEEDKAGAAALYYKAMQEYANGKLDQARAYLRSGAKLDPGNQDIANALIRIGKELPGSSGSKRAAP